ncbi:D-alanyl-D-alanine carboxypeptidase family protein [Streptomyces sp. NBC_00859]|uniref:D-alanyl-D-alanine carboxypeptidase family protein n=1 Tax=Streptomyces sp. NBC_00859 TaxID=2903682 RepID=UPI00386F569F|nr:D-alanyl-D-alanine carboxypeptidase [Streptomyces sp. NBC_00859]
MSQAMWCSVRIRAALAVSLPALVLASLSPSARADGRPVPEPGAHSGQSALYRTGVQVSPGAPKLPAATALSWMVTDLRTGRVLAAKDAHRPLPPASTLKTLFALALLPKFPPQEVHRAAGTDLSGLQPGSSMVGVKEGTRYTVADLWRGVFLASGNDAVHTLAMMNGGVPATLRDMRAAARRIGVQDTVVKSADGYDTPGQHSSAYDLSVIARAGLQNPEFRQFASTRRARFPAVGGPGAFGIQNTNRLLVGSHGVVRYPGLLGVKNGYTTEAGNTLVTAARRNGRTLLVTVMNPQAGQPNDAYTETRSLLDWGFSAAPTASPVGVLPGLPRARPTDPAASPVPAGHTPPVAASQAARIAFSGRAALAVTGALSAAALACALLVGRRRARKQSGRA